MKEGFNLGSIMNQVKNFQGSIEQIKKSLESQTVEGSAGGGIVKAIVTGNHKVKKIIISDEILNDKDKDMLEEMILAAVNDGLSRSEEMVKNEMQKFTSSLGLPLQGLM